MGGAGSGPAAAAGAPLRPPSPPRPSLVDRLTGQDSLAAARVQVETIVRELLRRAKAEFWVELPILRAKWRLLAACVLAQYAHGAASQLAHRRHTPSATPLRDAGFELLPTLRAAWVSEALFGLLFTLFVAWSASPFTADPRSPKAFHTVTLYTRTLTAVSVCQALRVAAFLATGLPAPAAHCRAGVPTATRPPPEHWWGHAVVDIARQAGHGCGDLIFSSHTTFALSGALAFTYHGGGGGGSLASLRHPLSSLSSLPRPHALRLAAVWAAVASLSLLIIASHKHYTVDVLVAWWTVPLVWAALRRRWDSVRGPGGGRVVVRRCPTCGECAKGGGVAAAAAAVELAGAPPKDRDNDEARLLIAAECGDVTAAAAGVKTAALG